MFSPSQGMSDLFAIHAEGVHEQYCRVESQALFFLGTLTLFAPFCPENPRAGFATPLPWDKVLPKGLFNDC